MLCVTGRRERWTTHKEGAFDRQEAWYLEGVPCVIGGFDASGASDATVCASDRQVRTVVSEPEGWARQSESDHGRQHIKALSSETCMAADYSVFE